MPARTIQAHLDRLVALGYLRRIDCAQGVASGYAVQRSKKWKPKLSVRTRRARTNPADYCALPAESAKGAPFLRRPSQDSATTPPFSAPYIEDITRHYKTTTRDAFGSFGPERRRRRPKIAHGGRGACGGLGLLPREAESLFHLRLHEKTSVDGRARSQSLQEARFRDGE